MTLNDNRIAFFCRAKPQGVDALDVFLENLGVYIGYPMLQMGVSYDPHNLQSCLVDFTCSDAEWEQQIEGQPHRNQKSRNRNFVPRVAQGSYVVIPRASEACFYLGRINSGFCIRNDPQNLDRYLERCREKHPRGSESLNRHRADVAMGWSVETYKKFGLSRLPCWLRSSLYGRSTYGEFKNHPVDADYTAVSFFDDLWEGAAYQPWDCTRDLEQIKRRLVETLTVSSFEHLIVNLLQLEHPDEKWVHSGGPGDGGIDGFGCDKYGNMTGIMQAKLTAARPPDLIDLTEGESDIRRYAAVLVLGAKPEKYPHILLDIDWVAEKLLTHAESVPFALTIRVGRQ